MLFLLKRAFRPFVPKRLKPQLVTLYLRLKAVLYTGSAVQCPLCGGEFSGFMSGLPAVKRRDAIEDADVVGSGKRPYCPQCLSKDRERHVYLWLRDMTSIFSSGGRLLHVAPEPNLRRRLSAAKLVYVTADREERDVHVRLDLTSLPFREGTFDIAICCHVLEHIPDDRAAIGEMFRALAPGGWAVLQVPISPKIEKTFEDPSITDPRERQRVFGQLDHVRIYGLDYLERVREAGFTVEEYRYADAHGEEAVSRYGLPPQEKLFICRKAT